MVNSEIDWVLPEKGSLWRDKCPHVMLGHRVHFLRSEWQKLSTIEEVAKKLLHWDIPTATMPYYHWQQCKEGDIVMIVESYLHRAQSVKETDTLHVRVIHKERVGDLVWTTPTKWHAEFERLM